MQICCNFKTQKCLSVSRNKERIVKFVINYHPSAIKLSISAPDHRQSTPLWMKLEKCSANVLQVHARTDHELFLSRIELISFLSSF